MTWKLRNVHWTSAWPDALAFAVGLGAALLGGWTARDLVWSLWLSSLVVGYAMILWTVLRPALLIGQGAWRDRAHVRLALAEGGGAPAIMVGSIAIVGSLFVVAFFTVHFGGFHYVHSQFLGIFFPLDGTAPRGMVGGDTYAEVLRRYWTFLPAAFLAERAAFAAKPPRAPDVSVTAEAIAARKARSSHQFQGMMAPYRNVVRMHLLIFFFAFASAASLDSFAIYGVVYAVYFFPWRLLRDA